MTEHADQVGEVVPPVPARLRRQRTFQACPVDEGDELYASGIFEFNITRLTASIVAHPDRFPISSAAVADIPDYPSSTLKENTVRAADLSRPILLAEIAPGHYALIDGHHRIAKARREGVLRLPAYRIACPAHVGFLTSVRAYDAYVAYWNSKLKQHQRASGPLTGRSR